MAWENVYCDCQDPRNLAAWPNCYYACQDLRILVHGKTSTMPGRIPECWWHGKTSTVPASISESWWHCKLLCPQGGNSLKLSDTVAANTCTLLSKRRNWNLCRYLPHNPHLRSAVCTRPYPTQPYKAPVCSCFLMFNSYLIIQIFFARHLFPNLPMGKVYWLW